MAAERAKTEIRLPNGDVLIVPTTERDPKVDAAFKTAMDEVRERNLARFVEFRAARAARRAAA